MSKTFSGRVWRHISSGEHHTIALDDEGQVFVMGRKEYGRLGLGPDCSDAEELTIVPTLSSIKCVDIGAGSRESFAVTESGTREIPTYQFFFVSFCIGYLATFLIQ